MHGTWSTNGGCSTAMPPKRLIQNPKLVMCTGKIICPNMRISRVPTSQRCFPRRAVAQHPELTQHDPAGKLLSSTCRDDPFSARIPDFSWAANYPSFFRWNIQPTDFNWIIPYLDRRKVTIKRYQCNSWYHPDIHLKNREIQQFPGFS